MARATVADRQATKAEVTAHAGAIHAAASRLALTDVRVRSDGTVVVHSDESGYRAILRLSGLASGLVGTYVHVITDDVPGAAGALEL
jgi:hypothetical protein